LIKTFFVIVALWVLSVLVHELGHLVGGLLIGFRFNYIRIGPLRIERSGKFNWRWSWRFLGGGATSALPVSRSALRWRLFLFVAAGPAASLACALYVFKIMPRNNSMGAAVGLGFVVISTLMGFTNLLPLQRKGTMLDGLKLWILLFSKRRRERLIFLLTFVADAKKGDLKSFMEDGALEQSSLIKDASSEEVVANWLAYAKATAQKDYGLAAACLERCLVASSTTTQDLREVLIIEAAKYQALRRGRPDLAREWLALEDSRRARPGRFVAEALILYRENQFDGALAKVEEALASIETEAQGTVRSTQEQSLRNLREALQKAGPRKADLDQFLT
jgi:hypothetical protein